MRYAIIVMAVAATLATNAVSFGFGYTLRGDRIYGAMVSKTTLIVEGHSLPITNGK